MTCCSCYCSLWWLAGIAWHGGMLSAIAACLWILDPPTAVGAVATSAVYLVCNVCLLRYFWLLEQRTQTQNEQQEQEQRQQTQESQSSSSSPPSPDTDTTVAQDNPSPATVPLSRRNMLRIPCYLSLVHLFTHLSLVVPGALVALLWIPCDDNQNYQRPENFWATNTSQLPPEVLTWMQQPELRSLNAFVQQPSTGDIYLTGSWEGSDNSLYIIPFGQTPQNLGYRNVFDLTSVSNETLCFSQVNFQRGGYYNYIPEISIGCGNAADGFTMESVNQRRKRQGRRQENVAIFHLQGIQGLLWFRLVTEDFFYMKDGRSDSCDFYIILEWSQQEMGPQPVCPWDSFAVLSMNTTTMEVTSYSSKVTRINPTTVSLQKVGSYSNGNEDDTDAYDTVNEDYYEADVNDEGVVAVSPGDEVIDDFFEKKSHDYLNMEDNDDDTFIVATKTAPLFCDSLSKSQALAAIFLSSLPLVISSARAWIKFAVPSASIALFVGLCLLCMFGWVILAPWDPWQGAWMWLGFGTPVWTVICTYQLVVNPRVSRPPLWWSLYCILTALVLVLFLAEFMELSHPREYFGSWIVWAMEFVFLDLPIAIIAILVDSQYFFALALVGFVSLAGTIAWEMSDPPMSYVYIGVALIVVVALFTCLYRYRHGLHERLVRWLSACARHTCAVEAYEGDNTRDEVNTTGLLDIQDAESA